MYKAVMLINVEIHKVNEKNQCEGIIVREQEMRENGLSNTMVVSIDAPTKNDCLTKLKDWIGQYEN